MKLFLVWWLKTFWLYKVAALLRSLFAFPAAPEVQFSFSQMARRVEQVNKLNLDIEIITAQMRWHIYLSPLCTSDAVRHRGICGMWPGGSILGECWDTYKGRWWHGWHASVGFYERQLLRVSDGVITWQRSIFGVAQWVGGSICWEVWVHLCTAIKCESGLWDTYYIIKASWWFTKDRKIIGNQGSETWSVTWDKGHPLTQTISAACNKNYTCVFILVIN